MGDSESEEDMYDTLQCRNCENVGFYKSSDSFIYCRICYVQDDSIRDTRVDAVDLVPAANRRKTTVKEEPFSHSQLWRFLNIGNEQHEDNKDNVKKEDEESHDFVISVGPNNGGGSRNPSCEDYFNEVRMKYVTGIQLMIQLQSQALVENFGANLLICGLTGPIWLRFLAISKVFDDDWAEEAVNESEMAKTGDIPDKVKQRAKYKAEPHNFYGERAILIWFRSLRKCIPLATSLSVCFLACHVARDKILPTDIVKWSLEGKLPYLVAFLNIEEKIGGPSKFCPLSSSIMFRPSQVISSQKLESMASSIALTVGLDLPPVNFYAIARRFLNELSLPVENIIQHACRIYEWSMPSELWLSANELRLPTRVCVMSILIVAIRILYNLNGFGKWEAALSKDKSPDHEDTSDPRLGSESTPSLYFNLDGSNTQPKCDTSSVSKYEAGAGELLCMLDEKYKEIETSYEYAKDLPTYLKYCKDVAFAGLKPCAEEENLIEQLWNYYQEIKDSRPSEDIGQRSDGGMNDKRSRDSDVSVDSLSKKGRAHKAANCEKTVQPIDHNPEDSFKEEAIRRLQSNMEENRFFYISPRSRIKRLDYLHYSRKRDDGALVYVAHADYYILLRSCAKVAQVDIRIMHMGVMGFERRLAWLEKRIDHCLTLKPPDTTKGFSSQIEAEDFMYEDN